MNKLLFASNVIVVSLLLSATIALADETISSPRANTPEHTVAAALRAGIAGDFKAYLATVHPDEKSTKSQRDQRKRYEWKRFQKQAHWYVKSKNPVTFVVANRRPDGKNQIRLFLRDQEHKESMPRPVKLKRDGKGWKITVSSL